MKIYCEVCRTSHWFTGKEAEELIYTLQGMLLDASSAEDEWTDELDCLQTVSGFARSIEMYAEHVSNNVQNRLATLTIPASQSKGEDTRGD